MSFEEALVSPILIAEGQQNWRDVLSGSLGRDYEVDFWDDDKSYSSLDRRKYDLAILDIGPATPEGTELFKQLRRRSPETKVIITSASSRPEDVVSAIKHGAVDFVAKPFSLEKIRITVQTHLDNIILKNEIDYLRRGQDTIYDLRKISAKSAAMKRVMEVLSRVAATDSTVLMTGETGTGKSFLSGTVHFNSARKKRPFVKIFCANMPETLLDSEFFGHEKGAFTGANKTRIGRFEQANGGTVFLDEIGDISPPLQSKLLRVLEEREFERLGGNKTITADIRVIAATNRNLEEAIAKGEFREDLYYRINVLQVRLPPLRERIEDIEDLAHHFLAKHSQTIRKRLEGITPTVLEMFKSYAWPGNIRQLSNTLERAVLLADGRMIEERHVALGGMTVPLETKTFQAPPAEAPAVSEQTKTLVDQEKQIIVEALEKSLWIQKDAAKLLGVSRRVLNYKIRKLGITHPRWRKNV